MHDPVEAGCARQHVVCRACWATPSLAGRCPCCLGAVREGAPFALSRAASEEISKVEIRCRNHRDDLGCKHEGMIAKAALHADDVGASGASEVGRRGRRRWLTVSLVLVAVRVQA